MAGFLEGRVKVPGVGEVPEAAAYGGIAVVGVLVIVWYRNKKSASSSTATGNAATPAGSGPYPSDGTSGNPSDPNSVDPATGITYGNEQAAAAQASSPYSSGGGGSSITDLYPWDGTSGNAQDPFSMDPSTGQTYGDEGSVGSPSGNVNGGPPFTSDSAWAQYAENYLTATVGLAAADVSAALGNYIDGLPVTSTQQTIISQAIAFAGNAPVAGPGGNPPGIVAQPNNGGGTGPQSAVPNVVGQALSAAESAVTAAGFTYQVQGASSGTVSAQSPAGGTAASAGTLVTLTAQAASAGSSGDISASLAGLPTTTAIARIQAAGARVNAVFNSAGQGVNPALYGQTKVIRAGYFGPGQGQAGANYANSYDLEVQ